MLYRSKHRPYRTAVEILWEPEPGSPLEKFAWADGFDADRAATIASLEGDAPAGTIITIRDGGPFLWIVDIVEAQDTA